MGYILKYVSHPVKVSIIPRGEAALGFSQQKPNNNLLMTKQEVLCKISVLLGGRCAEKIIYDDVSTGASDDIEKISTLIHHYTMHWGMNDSLGPLNPNVMGALVDTLDNKIMEQCNQIVKHIESQTMKYLNKHKCYIKEIATSLLTHETILYSQIKDILPESLENSSEILCL
jgi:cell division protease FtsH